MKSLFLSLFAASAAAASAAEPLVPFRDYEDSRHEPLRWKTGEPADARSRGEWWRVFADPTLDELITRALAGNQDLRAAAARVEQARAIAGMARSGYWPQVAANGDVARERTSSTMDVVSPDTLTTTYRAPLTFAWEIDLFGRVRNLTASARADAAATASTFEAVRLALTSDVAATYFSLRGLDAEQALMGDNVSLRRRSRELAHSRFTLGNGGEFDVTRADTELATTEADALALSARRAAVQNSLAVLVGAAASEFAIDSPRGAHPTLPNPPQLPSGLPATLLERRPDVAAAERILAAANARIGVAKAAFFPAISLTGQAGYASGDVDKLFSADSRIWSIGPALYLPIFQGGRNRANLERSRAAYDESIALYRQSVLVAFREVQDALVLTRILGEQSAAQSRARVAARRASEIAQTRYDAGLVSYLEVLDAQRTALAIERTSTQLAALRLNTAVALIKALGGGWEQTEVVAAR